MFKKFLLLLLFCSTQAFTALLTDEQKPTPEFAAVLEAVNIPSTYPIEIIAASLKEKCFQTGDRWNFEDRFEDKRETLLPLLDQLGCFDAVQASETHYDYGVVLGALRSSVEKRIGFLIDEWKRGVRFDRIVFLTGKRKLQPKENCNHLDSETEMMRFVWSETEMPEALRLIPLTIVDSPPAFGRDRATTESTVIAWLKMKPTPGHCLIFSSQPYVGYQDAILRTRLPPTFSIETVGPEGGRTLPTSVLMDNLNKWLQWSFIPK